MSEFDQFPVEVQKLLLAHLLVAPALAPGTSRGHPS